MFRVVHTLYVEEDYTPELVYSRLFLLFWNHGGQPTTKNESPCFREGPIGFIVKRGKRRGARLFVTVA